MEEFDESACKRDWHGRFSKKNTRGAKTEGLTRSKKNAKMSERARLEAEEFEKIKRDTFPYIDAKRCLQKMPKTAFGFAKDRLHTPHHEQHVREMGFKSSKEYERAAIEFWENGEGELYYSKRRDCYYKYNQKRKWFLSIDRDGIVRTFHVLPKKDFENAKEQDKCLSLTE